MIDQNAFRSKSWLQRVLQVSAAVVGLFTVGLTIQLLGQAFALDAAPTEHSWPTIPEFAYENWYDLAIQDGRTKPFQTACSEVVRQITGRTRFEGFDPVAVVLAWMLADGVASNGTWEEYRFILCDHHGLRQQLNVKQYAKYISPAELRQSVSFDRLLTEVGRKRNELQGRAHLELSTEHLKAEEVGRRLVLYDALCGRGATRLFRNALVGDRVVDLDEYHDIVGGSKEQAVIKLQARSSKLPDPFHLVGIDRVAGSGWLSLMELRAVQANPERWRTLVAQRLRETPERYLDAEAAAKLHEFQQRIETGAGPSAVAELRTILDERRERQLRRFEIANRTGDQVQRNLLFSQIVRSPAGQMQLQQALARTPNAMPAVQLIEELRRSSKQADDEVLERLESKIAVAKTMQANELRTLQLEYLESMFPQLYEDALAAQLFPGTKVDAVLEAFEHVRRAYAAGNKETFDSASLKFFRTVADTTNACEDKSTAYPGVATLGLELEFNRWQPFHWSWITMLVALCFLTLNLASGGRAVYRLGLVAYGLSLLWQTVGFIMRIVISGRAPVSNMYESIIFAAFMAAIFALILELIYRRTAIALAGAGVATLGLVLADQLPLALDPTISPMVPVLRTNFWLTVHVLTIVSSYAAGTLAWGLGNLTLAMMVFGKGSAETLKMLSSYTYRALQIAVLLLAAGTFLGGWWAAESWGRFWGWDPKEVGALIALICYVIPLHARYLGWIKDFGLAVAAILCYASILFSWYVVNFLVAAGLHSYGFGSGGGGWVLWVSLINVEWLLVASLLYLQKTSQRQVIRC